MSRPPEKPSTEQNSGYRIIRDSPGRYSVEGFFRHGSEERFSSASEFKTEAEARQWVYHRQAEERTAPFETAVLSNRPPPRARPPTL